LPAEPPRPIDGPAPEPIAEPPSPPPLPLGTTGADVDVELTVQCFAYDFRLELLADFGFVDSTTAIRTAIGQGSFVDLANVFGRRPSGLKATRAM